MEAIYKRRSIRKYVDEKIDRDKVEKILKAAMQAPSAHNHMPWEFIVMDEREVLDEVADAMEYAKMMHGSNLGILICGNTEQQPNINRLIMDCSAAIMNIIYEAQDMGIGSVWIDVCGLEKNIEAARRIFNLPESYYPVSYVCLGVPEFWKKSKDIFIEEKIHYNKEFK